MNRNRDVTRFAAWITKYALTKGIFSATVEDCSVSEMVVDTEAEYATYYHKNEWHRSKEKAVRRAEEMRTIKIASLTKSIEKINKLKFD